MSSSRSGSASASSKRSSRIESSLPPSRRTSSVALSDVHISSASDNKKTPRIPSRVPLDFTPHLEPPSPLFRRFWNLLHRRICSIRFIVVFFFVVFLSLNTAMLTSVQHILGWQSVGRVQSLRMEADGRYVSEVTRSYTGKTETILSNIAQYVRAVDAREAGNPNFVDLGFGNERFFRTELLPFFFSLQYSISRFDNSARVSCGFITTAGSLISPSSTRNKVFYHNVSANVNNTRDGWSPIIYWPLSGSYAPDGGPSWDLVDLETVVIPDFSLHYSVRHDDTLYNETMNSPVKGSTVQWTASGLHPEWYTQTAAMRVYGATNESESLLGIAYVRLGLAPTIEFLRESFSVKDHGIVYLLMNGTLHGSNSVDEDVYSVTDEHGVQPYLAVDSPNAMISQSARWIRQRTDNYQSLDGIADRVWHVGSLLVRVVPFVAAERGMMTVVVVPYSTVYSTVILSLGLSIGLTCAVFVLVLVISCLVTWRMTQPMYRLVSQLKKMENMDLDSIVVTPTAIAEISMIQGAFEFAVQKLKLLRSFLPANIFDEETTTVKSGDDESTSSCSLVASSTAASSSAISSFPESSSKTGVTSETVLSSPPMDHQFGLYLERVTRVFVVVKFFGIVALAESSSIAVISFTEMAYSTILLSAGAFRGVVNESSFDSFVVSFRCVHKATLFGLRVACAMKSRGVKFQIGVHECAIVQGNVGCSTVKKKVIFGSEFSAFRGIIEDPNVLSTFPIHNCRILLSGTAAERLSPEFVRFPIDVVRVSNNSSNSFTFILHQCCSFLPKQSDEWFYELDQDQKRGEFIDLQMGFDALLSGDMVRGVSLLKKFVDDQQPGEEQKEDDVSRSAFQAASNLLALFQMGILSSEEDVSVETLLQGEFPSIGAMVLKSFQRDHINESAVVDVMG